MVLLCWIRTDILMEVAVQVCLSRTSQERLRNVAQATHQTATDLKLLDQDEDIFPPHQPLPLGLLQQSSGVLSIAQHHDHCRADTHTHTHTHTKTHTHK